MKQDVQPGQSIEVSFIPRQPKYDSFFPFKVGFRVQILNPSLSEFKPVPSSKDIF